MKFELLIFDFDGVIADSETLACTVLSEVFQAEGIAVTPAEAIARFTGRRLADVVEAAEAMAGRSLPHLGVTLTEATLRRISESLCEISGAGRFIRRLPANRTCIASSSSMERLETSLRKLELNDFFDGRVFSADSVARGKPFPDIFLHAASRMSAAPAQTVVIEDSLGGVAAGRAAGMHVIGLAAASHLGSRHAQRLHDAGAHDVVAGYDELEWLIARMARP